MFRCDGQEVGGIGRWRRNRPVEGARERGKGRGNSSSSSSLVFFGESFVDDEVEYCLELFAVRQ